MGSRVSSSELGPIRAIPGPGAAQSLTLRHLLARGKTDIMIFEVELGVNIFQENVTEGPVLC
jgi:hypothetical protein